MKPRTADKRDQKNQTTDQWRHCCSCRDL